MAKKALWVVAGLAVVIILGVVYFNGTRTVDQGAQGTIGGAERYRGAQPANVAVTEGDVQKFLQSDVFDRIIKDEHALKLFTDKETRGAMGSDAFEALIRDDAALRALQDDAVEAMLLKPEARLALGNEDVVAVFSNASLVKALQDGELSADLARRKKLVQSLQDEEVAAVLSRSAVQRSLADYADAAGIQNRRQMQDANAELEAALKGSPARVRQMVGDAEVFSALTKKRLAAELYTNAAFLRAMRSENGRNLFMNPGLAVALKQGDAAKLFLNLHFQDALKQYPKLFEDAALFAAFDNAELVGLLKTNTALKASLQGDAMDAALVKRAPKK